MEDIAMEALKVICMFIVGIGMTIIGIKEINKNMKKQSC